MTDFQLDADLIHCLSINSNDRTHKEIQTIASFLRGLHCFSRLAEQPLRVIARCARYEAHRASAVLYRKNQLSTCWYILLSGSVFIGGNMYLPPYSFGKRTGNSNRRANDCHVLLASEMIVIDYPDVQNIPMTTLDYRSTGGQNQHQQNSNDIQKRRAVTSMNLDHMIPPSGAEASSSTFAQSSTVYQYSTSKGAKSPVHSRFAPHGEKMRDMETVNVQQRFNYDNVNSAVTSTLYRRCPPLSDIQERCGSSQSSSSSTQAAPQPPSHGRHNSNSSTCGGGGGASPSGTAAKFFHRPSFRRHSSTNSAASTDRFSTSTTHSRTATECDDELADLPEVNVDTDEEDDESCPSSDSFMELRDNVRECLERDPSERNEDDILVLLDFMQHMPAFANLPVRIKRELCLKMVFAVVEKANTTIMRDGEQMDSWSVLVNGEIEVLLPDGSRIEYHLGDSFGVDPRPEVQHQSGEMRTLVDDCQFVLVAQADYVETMSKASDNLRKQTDAAGEIISETEKRVLENNREGYVLIKGKPEKLIQALIEDRDTNVDQYYVEDFLLMYRTFIENPVDILDKFLTWFNEEPHLREKVARLVLLWVNNHFNDFETEPQMTSLLEQFEQSLEQENMINHQQLLNIACSVKSRARVVVYTRSNRDEMLHFSVLGGAATLSEPNSSHGIFISNVENNSQAQKIGLKRGDQILEVNNVSFLSISLKKALEILRGASLLSITVKANVLGFKEMISEDNENNSGDGKPLLQSRRLLAPLSPNAMCSSESSSSNVYLVPRTKSYGSQGGSMLKISAPGAPKQLHHAHSYVDGRQMPGLATFVNRGSVPGSPVAKQQMSNETSAKESSSTGSCLSKLIKKIKHGTSSSSLPMGEDKVDGCHGTAVNFNPAVTSTAANQLNVGSSQILEQTPLLPRPLKHSRSNPDISKQILSSSNNSSNNQISKYYQTPRPACPEHVLKIYRTDQTYKYLSVYKDTTVQSVIFMALQEFGIIPTIVDDATQQPCSSKVPSSGDWSLYELIVNSDNIKRRRLPDHMHNLAERMTLNSRYYLTKNTSCEPLVPDHLAPELLKESQTTLIELNANILAAQLTLQDFSIFASIEPTEYVDNLFQNKDSKYGWPKLEHFEHLVNKEMWWTATEVCREKNLIRRAKIIKKLIKVARQCRDFKNFNSMFAIVSGLEKPCVRRLHATWDKVSSKSLKMLEDLQLLLDPSRNMSKYRQHLIQTSCEPPVIPLFPVVRKDLYFIHECNATFCDGLVNFEKLRMIAKEIRNVTKLASSPYELSAMCEQSGGGGSSRINDALLYMNSFEGGAAIATMRKQFMQRGPLSRKKVYEQALMVRRVKSYLSNLSVIENENELDKMSLECEAQPSSSLNAANSSQNRRRQPSPSPSSASSASRTSSEANKRNLQPKFGVESPQAVQRMLALVDHSKTKNAHHLGSHGRSSSPPPLTSPNIFRRPRIGLNGGAVHHHHNNGPFMAGGSQMIAPSLPPHNMGHGRSQSESTRQPMNSYQNVTIPPPNYYSYHHQTTAPAALQPVDLTAESSSVNILISPLRLHSSGSVTSTDSGLTNHSNAGSQSSSNLCTNILLQHQNSAGISHAVSCDSTDSGHCSIDAASSLLANHRLHHHHASPISASDSSPPNQRRSYPLNPHSKMLMASSISEGRKQTLVSYPSQDSTRSSGIVDISGQYFAECQQQTIRRTNSIPSSSAGGNGDNSNDGHNQEIGEQISRV